MNDTLIEQNFLDLFMCNMEITYFWSYLIWAYIGVIINLIFELNKRKPKSITSPQKFSGKYYINDNWKRLLIGLFLIPISILIFGGLFGMEITNDRALFMGLGLDNLVEIYKRKKFQSTNINK